MLGTDRRDWTFDRLKDTFPILTKKEKMGPSEDCRFGDVKMIFQFCP